MISHSNHHQASPSARCRSHRLTILLIHLTSRTTLSGKSQDYLYFRVRKLRQRGGVTWEGIWTQAAGHEPLFIALILWRTAERHESPMLLALSRISSLSKATHAYFWSLARSLKTNTFDLELFFGNPWRTWSPVHLSPASRLSLLCLIIWHTGLVSNTQGEVYPMVKMKEKWKKNLSPRLWSTSSQKRAESCSEIPSSFCLHMQKDAATLITPLNLGSKHLLI